ncbi:hypothetical protein C1N91_06150 [Curtobacterium sp. SGAir0471]|nr:hypothetical protein C1N91_06150 [Curtobacterium sp. SGAir0471]
MAGDPALALPPWSHDMPSHRKLSGKSCDLSGRRRQVVRPELAVFRTPSPRVGRRAGATRRQRAGA